MRILILNPAYGKGFVRSQRWPARSRGRVQRHPDYLAIATAVLEKDGHQVKLLDAAAMDMPLSEVGEIARDFKPELSIVHTTTPSIYNDVEHAATMKNLGATTVLIGAHASTLPEETIQLSYKIDYIARGEYDYTLRDLANQKPPSDILGITFRNGKEIIHNKPRPLIENLDELPFPAWHQIDIYNYYDYKPFPFITMISGRGCPNSCSFCVLPQVLYGKKYRLRSASNVVDEIEYDLALFPDLKAIMFEDDTLTADRNRTREICNEILRRGLKIPWWANARADLDDLDLMRLMKESGCRMLVVGFEFGDQHILDNVHKRLTTEQMKEFSMMAKRAGIKVHGCFMVGGPGETKETAGKTTQLIRDLKPDTIQISALTPYPGTEFYNWCKEYNYITAKDWTEWVDGTEQTTVISYPNLSRKEIIDLVDKGLYQNFYLRPSTWWHHLSTVESFDDFKQKARAVGSLADYWCRKRIR